MVRTSLDLQLQRTLQTRVSEQVAQLHSLNLDQAGMVVRGGMVGHPHAVLSATLPDGTRWVPAREPDRRGS